MHVKSNENIIIVTFSKRQIYTILNIRGRWLQPTTRYLPRAVHNSPVIQQTGPTCLRRIYVVIHINYRAPVSSRVSKRNRRSHARDGTPQTRWLRPKFQQEFERFQDRPIASFEQRRGKFYVIDGRTVPARNLVNTRRPVNKLMSSPRDPFNECRTRQNERGTRMGS